jgi:hypothetical protein
MKSTRTQDRVTQDEGKPTFDCDVSRDGFDDACVRAYLLTHMPLAV